MTDGTVGLAAVTGQHDAVLYLVLILPDHLEELIDTWFLFLATVRWQSVPQPVFLLLCQVHVWLEDGEVIVGGVTDEPLLPLLHLLAMPADDAAFVDRERGIGNDQSLVDADDLAESLTLRASADG